MRINDFYNILELVSSPKNDLKQKFNPERITFPMIFDSSNNVETDQEKKQTLVEYIMESSDQFSQLIVSAIGFLEKDYSINSNINIKVLENKKYNLLNNEMHVQNYEILQCMNDV
ncbi:hypothetical protein [Veillonella sp. VA141]|uniref:hypothetical protein n=1 Tax=Veillonella sp. VA141 TaxID=741833 RepID=UPI0019810F20|nr:hypothetical protein [Veillonella sp. VA141]